MKNKKNLLIVLAVAAIAVIGAAAAILLWPVPVEKGYSFALEQEAITLTVGESETAIPVFTPLDEKKAAKAAKKLEELVLTWTSSDESVATVDEAGIVSAHKKGEAVITASFGKKGTSASVTVKVLPPLESITPAVSSMEMNVGDTETIDFDISPVDALKDGILFTSDHNYIVKVDENGSMTATHPGTAVISLDKGDVHAEVSVTVYAPIKSIRMNRDTAEMIGTEKTLELSTVIFPINTTDPTDTVWTSSDEKIATVDENGVVTAVNPGKVTITAAIGEFTAECEVEIRIPMTGISLSTKQLTVRAGESVTLPLSYEPGNTSDDRTTTWKSSNEGVASVNENGTVTAKAPGNTTITATCGEFTASAAITVIIPVTGVAISQTSLTLVKGTSGSLAASVVPANTTESPYITWSSDNPKVARVENGVVTAVGAGTCTITANHDLVGATCQVNVISPMTGISIDQSSVSIVKTFTASLSVSYAPLDTTDSKALSWSSDNPAIATVSDGVVTAVSEGTCTITAVCGGLSSTTTVTVTPFVDVESISISAGSLSFGGPGEQQQLSAGISPSDASVAGVSWSSSNPAVATVSGSGVVTAVGGGSCTITASAGGKSASCAVNVAAANIVVVLDPGHDVNHRGASYNGLLEDQLTYSVASYCKSYLESHYYGVTVYLTRSAGSCLAPALRDDLEARAQFAQDRGARILVSLHFNASTSHSASGALCFVSKQPNVASACNALAGQILARICSSTGLANLGAVATNSDTYFDQYGNPMDYYAINRHCANRGIPGIIVEHCFMDHDLSFCDGDDDLQRFAAADAQGIAAYLGLQAR